MSDMSNSTRKAAEGLVFTVNNRHVAQCGRPTGIDGNVRGRYFGYFENEHGEQAVFVYEYGKEEGTLFLGDLNWEKPIRVVDGRAPEVTPTYEEGQWLLACWKAATRLKDARRQPTQ